MTWISLMYANQTAKISMGGHLSETTVLALGVHQGCLLSPLLFKLVIEELAMAVWPNEIIVGIQILGTHHKTALYADDAIFFYVKPAVSPFRLSPFPAINYNSLSIQHWLLFTFYTLSTSSSLIQIDN